MTKEVAREFPATSLFICVTLLHQLQLGSLTYQNGTAVVDISAVIQIFYDVVLHLSHTFLVTVRLFHPCQDSLLLAAKGRQLYRIRLADDFRTGSLYCFSTD